MIHGPAFPSDRHISPSSGGPATARADAARGGFRPFGKDGFSFRDLLDIINPLQHIPVVSTIYRKLTGDALDAVPRLAGGTLFGGIAGAVSAVVNLVVKDASGKDIGENALAFLQGGFSEEETVNAPAAPDPAPSDPMLALGKPKPVFTAGWQAAMAMPYCDAECLDPKTSFFSDAVSMAAAFPDTGRAAARYAKATELAADAAVLRLDLHG
jgi:hypothetical protein